MVGKRPYLLFSPFIRLHPFTHFILGEGSRKPKNRELGTLGPCTRNGASPLCDSGKGNAPLWDSIPSSVKRGVLLDNLCGPFSSNEWWLDVFFDSLIRSKKTLPYPWIDVWREGCIWGPVLCDPGIRKPGSQHSQLLLDRRGHAGAK